MQLASDGASTMTLAQRLVDLVDASVRSAYPRASVTVILDHSVEFDRIAVVAPDPAAHEAGVRRLVEAARGRLGG